jgi:hypothetical protein
VEKLTAKRWQMLICPMTTWNRATFVGKETGTRFGELGTLPKRPKMLTNDTAVLGMLASLFYD